jgi:acetylornithine deacetylase/succinyl-diaminopimelate desuccinylase-like protein
VTATIGVDSELDVDYLLSTLVDLARWDTAVPLGYQTFIQPDDPKLVRYTQSVIRPKLAALGLTIIDAAPNNVVAAFGQGTSKRSILIQNYTVAQHHHEATTTELAGTVKTVQRGGQPTRVVVGQGVSQAKAHQAVMLAVLRMLRESRVELKGTLYWAVNNEGESSHRCSRAILSALERKPYFALLQLDTDLAISAGNRGRVDVNVHVKGRATHSSAPHAGLSAIDGFYHVLQRLKSMPWADKHPLLGGRQAIAYKVRFEPVAPHTLPSDAYIAIDRRLLPGDRPGDAVDEIRRVIGNMSPYHVTVEMGPYMLPALVSPDEPGLRSLARAHAGVTGREARLVYPASTFDAGAGTEAGIPTVMYGAGGTAGLLDADHVLIDDVVAEARVLAAYIQAELG